MLGHSTLVEEARAILDKTQFFSQLRWVGSLFVGLSFAK